MPRRTENGTTIKSPTKAQVAELLWMREQERILTREAALNDFWTFLTTCLWPDSWQQHFQESFHKPIADRVTAAKPGCRDLLLAPRASRKTMMRTVAHAVWRIVRDYNVRVLVVSSLDSTAVSFVETIKRQFQQNKTLAHFFPEAAVPDGKLGTVYEFTHPMRDNINLIDPTVRSTYLGAPFAGRRCDVLIMDDIVEERHITTPEQADKALKWTLALFPIVDRNERYNQIFVNGTRWSHNDPYGAMMGEDRGDEQEVGYTEAPFQSVVRAALEDADGNPDINGKPTFDLVLNRAELMQELARCKMDAKRGEEWWHRQYQNVVSSPSGMKFLPEWFNCWTPVLPPTAFSAIALDSATKDAQVLNRGDFCVLLVGHMDMHGNLFLTDGARSDAWRSADLMREMVAMAQRAGGVYNVLKEKCGEDSLFGMMEDAYHRQRLPITTYPLNVRQEGKKIVRIIQALQGPAQGRKIYFVGDPVAGTGFPRALQKVICDEAAHVGQWSHDDAIDALSLFYHPEVRIIPSANRGVKWTPFTRARLQQPSTPRFNMGAVRTQPRTHEDGTMRADPFVSQVIEHMGGAPAGNMPQRRSPFSSKVPIIRGLEDL